MKNPKVHSYVWAKSHHSKAFILKVSRKNKTVKCYIKGFYDFVTLPFEKIRKLNLS